MSDEDSTVARRYALRAAPLRGGFICLLSAFTLGTLIVLGPAQFAFATSFFETKITAHDAAAGDQFGFAVSVAEDTAIVGAPFDDDAGSASGGAYVFQRDEGGVDNWGELKKFTAADATAGDEFGYAVAISGNTVVVGAPLDDDAGSASGAAYVFERDIGGSDNWGFVKKLTHSVAASGDEFGFAVAISGDTIVVGAPTDDAADSEAGAAYVFLRDAGGSENWGQVKQLTASDAAAGDEFGFAVVIDDDTVAVGAPFTGSNAGSVYVFERASGGAENWGQVERLKASDADVGDQFGFAVSINQDTILIGARFFTGRTEVTPPPIPTNPFPEPIEIDLDNAGAVYYFERDPQDAEAWDQVRKRTAKNTQAGDQFGFSVAIRGNHAVVGSPYAGSYIHGAAYVHERSRGGRNRWGQLDKLTDPDGRRWDEYGSSVSISADTVVVGASESDAQCPDDRGCDSGSAYVYTVTQTRDQQKCINALNKGLAKVSAAHGRVFSKCVRKYARTGSSAETCLVAEDSPVEKAEQRTLKWDAKKCTESAPNFGATDAVTVNDAAMQMETDVIREIFGDDLDSALVTKAVDKEFAKCQDAVVKSVNKCQKSTLNEFNRCKKRGLRKAEIRTSVDLEGCWNDDPKGRVAKACDPLSGRLATRVLPRKCTSRGVDLSSAFPGCGTADPAGLAICVDQTLECRICTALNRADDLALDCDLLDDGVGNSSCL